jgi:hypothetical protein
VHICTVAVASDILNNVQQLRINTREDCNGTSFFGLSIVSICDKATEFKPLDICCARV